MNERLIIRKRKLSDAQRAAIAKQKRTFIIEPKQLLTEADKYTFDTMGEIRADMNKRLHRRK